MVHVDNDCQIYMCVRDQLVCGSNLDLSGSGVRHGDLLPAFLGEAS